MENCIVCGKPIERKLFKVKIDGEEHENVCESCSVCVYNIEHPETVSKETIKYCENKLKKIRDEDNTPENIKEWINDLLENRKKVEATQSQSQVNTTFLKNEYQATSSHAGTIHGKTFWCSLIKIVSICEIILFVIIGIALGAALDDDFIFVGAIIGGITGAILNFFNMFIVEVAQNIASCVDLLSKIESKME